MEGFFALLNNSIILASLKSWDMAEQLVERDLSATQMEYIRLFAKRKRRYGAIKILHSLRGPNGLIGD